MIPLIFLFISLSKGITLHLVPHSHSDLGWLRTEDQYFFGCDGDSNNVNVIISEIVGSLLVDPDRRAVWAEISFLKKWYGLQTSQMRNRLKEVIRSGQLEIVNGGMSMPDEACTNYEDLIDNFVLGHQFVYDKFGVTPLIGYQIDSFGHSSVLAELMIEMGYKGLVLTRIHYHDKETRKKDKSLEFMWHPFDSQKGIFTHIMFNHYSSPTGLHFEGIWKDSPFVADQESDCYNAEYVTELLYNQALNWTSAYQSQNILVFVGDDFTLSSAERTFGSLDMLISHTKTHSRFDLDIKYSTISEYFETIKAEKSIYQKYTHDFFPYADHPYSYWSGYFSSRPSLKLQIKKFADFVRATERLVTHHALYNYQNITEEEISWKLSKVNKIKEYLALLQHHDAITGTARIEVTKNYAKQIAKHENSVIDLYQDTLDNSVTNLIRCQLNSTVCQILREMWVTEDPIKLVVFNPKYTYTSQVLEIQVFTSNIQVADEDQNILKTQVLQDMHPFYSSSMSIGRYLLLIPVTISPLSIRTYTLFVSDYAPFIIDYSLTTKSGSISNTDYKIEFSTNFFKITHEDQEINILMNYEYYTSNIADNVDKQASGTYIFRPGVPHESSSKLCQYKTFKIIKTSLLERIHFKCGTEATTKITLWNYGDEKLPIIEHYIKAISEIEGKEIIVRYNTDWQHDERFFVDSNGLKKIYRNWNEVSGEKFEAKEPVAGNYYAITSYIGFESHNKTFGIFVDRPQGGTATQNHKTATHHGSDIEIMLLRKCLKDDNRGVSSPLLEVAEDGTNLNILTLHKLWLQNDSQDVAEIQRPYESPLQLFFGKSKDHPIKKNLSNLLNQNLLTHTHLKDPNTLIIRIKCTNETQVFDESFFENILNNRKMTGKITQLNLAENADYRRSQSEWGDDDFVFDNFEKIEKNWEELEDFRFTCKGYPIKSFEIKFIR